VAHGFRVQGEGHRGDLFAATSPLEAQTLLFFMSPDPRKMVLIDTKKAYLNGQADRGT
jgi:hypothetical protein